MAPLRTLQHSVVHRLAAQLHCRHAIVPQTFQCHSIDGIRPCRHPDAFYLTTFQEGLRRSQQLFLGLRQKGSKAPTVKGQLTARFGPPESAFNLLCHLLRCHRSIHTGDLLLIAEYAEAGTACMGDKQRDNPSFRHGLTYKSGRTANEVPHSRAPFAIRPLFYELGYSAAMAAWAAACSARFLLLPEPAPTTLPLRLTST